MCVCVWCARACVVEVEDLEPDLAHGTPMSGRLLAGIDAWQHALIDVRKGLGRLLADIDAWLLGSMHVDPQDSR